MTAPIAVQLYSLRDAIAQDLERVLNQVAEIGYIGIEPFGGMPFEKTAPLAHSLGLQCASMHSALPLGDDKNQVLEMANAYGVKYIVAPYEPPVNFTTLEGIKEVSDRMNEAAANATAAGYGFAYHNHDFEFVQVEGRPAYSIFLEHLDPAVKLEVDTYWVKVGGSDPLQVVTDLGARAPLLHIKDGSAVKGDSMLAVGDGVMDFPAIIAAGAAHTEWLIVELDFCDTDMMEAVRKSYQYLTREGLAHGK